MKTTLKNMFSGKKKLTDEQKTTLYWLNEEHKKAIGQYMENPASFDNVLVFLRQYKELLKKYLEFMDPFLSDQMKQAEKIAEAKWNIVRLFNAKHKQEKYKGLLAEIYSLLFDDKLKELMEKAFAGKPVTGIHVGYNAEEKSGYKSGNGFHEQFTYKISLSDGTAIKWHSLEDETQIQSARDAFEQYIPPPKKAKRPEPEPVVQSSETPQTMPRVSGSNTYFFRPAPIKPQQTVMDYIGTVCAMLGGM